MSSLGISKAPDVSLSISENLCRLIGKDLQGSCTEEGGSGNRYVFIDPDNDDVYRIILTGQYWTVLLMEAKGPEALAQDVDKHFKNCRIIWTTVPDPAAVNAKKLIDWVLAFVQKDTDFRVQFVSSMSEVKTDINRKTYDTAIGIIRHHSRRVTGGTECVIELTAQGVGLMVLHDAKSGAAQMGDTVRELPF